ncbi:MAG TPA: ABC transporter permease [Tepidisphaeraceae bacterium]|nr:ABC transporter permease [Tepidisphaeraceae bacterium]
MREILRLPFAMLVLLYQSMVLALSQIWANKVRGVLTTLGILIGVAAVSAVIALITGMKQRVLNEFEAFGTNKIFVHPHWPRNMRANFSWRQIMFRLDDFDDLLLHCPSVAKVTKLSENRGTIAYGPKVDEGYASIMGVDPDWHDIEHRYVTIGRPLTVLDNVQRRPVCLINQVVRDKLEMSRDPVGESIEVDGNRMLVVGLLEPPAATMGGSGEQREVVVPFTYLISRQRWPYFTVLAASKGPQLSDDAQAEIEFFLRQQRRIKPGKPDTFQVETAQRIVEQFNKVASMVTLIATGIVGISLLVGGVGIMNIMLVSVSERTREIGLRKAVGARPSAILLQFLVEAIMLCLVGGAMGLVLGQGMTSAVASFLPPEMKVDRMIIPPSAIVLAFTFSAGVGLIFGMFPAIKAARLDPIEALRHE